MIEPPLRFSPGTAVPHPLGIRPSGNLFLSNDVQQSVQARKNSLGFFASLSEDIFVDILSYLDAPQLIKLEPVSKYFLAFSFHVDLWRDLFWETFPDRNRTSTLCMEGSWRESLLNHMKNEKVTDSENKRPRVSSDDEIYPRLSDVYSDTLYSPYRSSGLVPTAAWLTRENIDRVNWKDISVSEFVEKYEKHNKPVIITGFVADKWGEINESWRDVSGIVSALSTENDPVFDCGIHHFRMSEFKEYIDSGIFRLDEAPIFVFDTKTFSKSQILQNYSEIPFFENDLFDLLTGENRPDNAWLLVGPPGASSKWHVDPNATNAWNAIITGEKKWVLLPPHLGPPPGVEMSSDGFAVRQPVTLTEWLDGGFYSDLYDRFHGKGLVEATCKAGEIMFIPRGWWHCVRNTGDATTIAITQNYAAESSVDNVRRFLKQFSHCVSGVPQHVRAKLWLEFDKVLKEKRPDLINGDIDEELEADPVMAGDSDNESCCGGGQQHFSFWDHFSTGTKSLNFER